MKFTFESIGVVRSPFRERVEAPRQPSAAEARGVAGTVELFPGREFEHALVDLERFTHLWLVFVFHLNVEQDRGWRPKVQPPRSATKRGVFATRSPHRPNPIGISVVRLERVEGLTLHVRDLDLLDGTPVLDLKPYVPYADAVPSAGRGWLGDDPEQPWEVRFTPVAAAQLAWLLARGVRLEEPIARALALGPHPNPSRRIRREPSGGMRLGLKEWRVDFSFAERAISVERVRSGYRPQQLVSDPALVLHREFAAAF